MQLKPLLPARTHTGRRIAGGTTATVVALAMLPAIAAPAGAAGGYEFTKVVDSAADNFNPQTLRLSCPSLNTGGDIAFKSERGGQDGIHRADAGGGVTTIAEVGSGFTLLANGNPSMNDSGQVSFGASLSDGRRTIMRGDGSFLTEIASTSAHGFTSFGFSTSINDTGEVAFDGKLSSGASGLFSGAGSATTTHYQNDGDAAVDDSLARFNATSDRPSINNLGDIAFLDEIQQSFRQDIFRGQEQSFTTISASNAPSAATTPLLNDDGTVIWQTQILDDSGFAVRAIVKGDGVGADTTVADSSGAFDIFHSYAMNNTGAVAFSATVDEDLLGIPSIFVGPNTKKDRIIGPGDKLDGGTVVGLNFCEEGLNDLGQLAFVAEIEDRDGEVRVAVFRATTALKM